MDCAHLEMIRTSTPHPIITSLEPGETWSWCYVDEIAMELD